MKKKKKRGGYAPNMDKHTRAVIDEVIRMRARMRVRDAAGNERIFRSTVAEEQEEGSG